MTLRDKFERYMRPMPYEDDVSKWVDASMEERGRTLADLLMFVDAVGRFPPKEDLLVVFPPRRRTSTRP